MSNKPTLTNWDTSLTNLIAVTGTHQTSGYASNEIPLSSELNGLFNNVTKWTSFMNDVLGTAAVAAADINIGSGGGATGTITAAGLITSAGLTSSALVTANAGITLGANQNITLSGTGYIKHGTRTLQLHPHGLVSIATGAQAPVYQQGISSNVRTDFVTSSTPVNAAVPVWGLSVGDRIVNVRVYMKDVSGQPVLTAKLLGGDRAGGGAYNATTASSAASGATQTLTLTGVNHTLGTTSSGPVSIAVSMLTNGTGTYSVFAVEIDYDTP